MTSKIAPLKQYLVSSRSIHYSLILTLPALVVYELGITILFRDTWFELRNSGEILLRSFFAELGLQNPYLILGLLTLIFLLVMIRGYRIEQQPGIHADYYLYMLMESMLWGSLIYVVMQLFTRLPLQILTLEDKLANLNLAIGAGIFEELIFRMLIIGALLIIFQRGLQFNNWWANAGSILLAAVIFAAFHLFGETYSRPVFAQRVWGGILLGLLYRFRGYGISVYSHVIYNILILATSW